MSFRGLLVLVLALLAAVALLIGLGRDKPVGTSEPAEALLLAAFDEASIREIDVSCEGSSLALRRADRGMWRIVGAGDAEADPRRVRELVSALQDAKARKPIEPGSSNPAAFGLEPAVCRVRVVLVPGAGERTLRVGRTSPVGTERYASREDGRIVLTDGSLYSAVARRADDYRETRLIPVEAEAVTRIVIDRPGERLVLLEDAGTWRIESPVRDRASAGACAQLARAVTGMALEAAGSTVRPIGARIDRRLGIEVSARGAPGSYVAFVARAGVGGRRVAWRDDGALVGLVDESAARELEQPAAALRDRRVLSFSSPDARWIELTRGAGAMRLERAGEGSGWTGREDETVVPVDADRVNALLESLRALTAVGFVPTAPTPRTGSIVVGGTSGAFGTVAWGPLPKDSGGGGESLWIATPDRPGTVFRVLASDLGSIPVHAKDLAPTAAARGTGS